MFFEMMNEQRVRQDIDERIRRARTRRFVARVKATRTGATPRASRDLF